MKAHILFSLIACPLFFANAQVEGGYQIVDGNQIRLTGRGVRSGNSAESIALACYLDEECTQVRFLHFIDNQTVEWIGAPLQLTPFNSKAQRLEIQEYLVKRGQVPPALIDSDRGDVIGKVLVFIGTPASYGLATAITTVAAEVVAVTFAPAFIFIGTSFLLIPKQAQFISNKASDTMTLTQGKDGWSWSQNPRRMKPHKFAELLRIIQSDINTNYTIEQQDALRRYERKIQKAKLRKKNYQIEWGTH